MWFILSSYGLVFGGLAMLTLWSILTYQRAQNRLKQLQKDVDTHEDNLS